MTNHLNKEEIKYYQIVQKYCKDEISYDTLLSLLEIADLTKYLPDAIKNKKIINNSELNNKLIFLHNFLWDTSNEITAHIFNLKKDYTDPATHIYLSAPYLWEHARMLVGSLIKENIQFVPEEEEEEKEFDTGCSCCGSW